MTEQTKDQLEETRRVLKEMAPIVPACTAEGDAIIDKTADQSTPMTPQQKEKE